MSHADALENELKNINALIEKHKDKIKSLQRREQELKLKIQEVKIHNTSRHIRGCGKIMYGSEHQAKIAMRQINSQLIDENKKLIRIYFCSECNAHHLTSK